MTSSNADGREAAAPSVDLKARRHGRGMIEWFGDDVLHVRPFLTVTLGILALFAGKAGNQRVALLREYSIPEPVTGGLLFAIALGLCMRSSASSWTSS